MTGVVAREGQSGTTSSPSRTRPAFDSSIKMHNGLLTIAVRSRPLAAVLEEISRTARMGIMLAETRGESPPISLQIKDLPLDQALLRILKGYDSFFSYGPDERGRPS